MISKKLKISEGYTVLNFDYIKAFILNDPYAVFSAVLFNDNNKLNSIAAINFETANRCSSCSLKLCNIHKKCYAISDATKYAIHHKNTIDGAAVIKAVKKDALLFDLFNKFLKVMQINLLRYNIVGDFSSKQDILFIKKLCLMHQNIKFYGYSKRLDLAETLAEALQSCNNFYIGCSKRLYKKLKPYGANFYNTTASVKIYITAKNSCKGSCLNCCKCFSLKTEVITCFIHGAPSFIQRDINTSANTNYLKQHIEKKLNIKLNVPTSGYFITKFNKALEAEGYKVPYKLNNDGKKQYLIKTLNDILKFIDFNAAAANAAVKN